MWRWWLPIALLALVFALIFVDPFVGDWDALDYTVLAVQGYPSSMVLGRALFIFENHLLWRLAHAIFAVPPDKAYLLFKYAVVAQSPLTVVAWWQLALNLTNSSRAATLAALLLALSPFFIIYSGQVMTEIPSLLVLAVALLVHLRGLRSRRLGMMLLGATILGLSVNVREAALLYAPWLLIAPLACGWKLRRRELAITTLSCFIFMLVAFGPFLLLLWSNFGNFNSAWRHWVELSRLESLRHPVTSGNLLPLLHYFFVAAPVVFVVFTFAAISEWRQRGLSPLLLLGLIGLCANLSLIVHYSVVLNWRYMLTGMPAMAPLVANFLLSSSTIRLNSERRAFAGVVAGLLVITTIAGLFAWPMDRKYLTDRALAKDYRTSLARVPRDAVMISGSQTVAVNYWRGLGAGEWDVIGTGSSWPGAELPAVIATSLAHGRRVFLDADPRWWGINSWQQLEIGELAEIKPRFHFRFISDTIYEISSLNDSATPEPMPVTKVLLMKN